jgi:uncharacterized OsmC-like protein
MTSANGGFTAGSLSNPAVEPQAGFSLTIRLFADYEQIVDFRMPGVAVLGLDERPPLGHGWGPTPAQLLGSALGACLAGALLRCMRDADAEVVDMRTDVSGTLRRDAFGRSHIAGIVVRLSPIVASSEHLRFVPTPERVTDCSMIVDSLRTDIGLQLVITPEVWSASRGPARDIVRLVTGAPGAADVCPPCEDRAVS